MVVTGEEAISKVRSLNPDLVIMDIKLQGKMDGIEAIELICAEVDVLFIYLTAFSDEATLQRAKNTEPFGYIIKPFKERELHIVIEVALCRHRIGREMKENAELRDALLESAERAVRMRDDILAVVSHDLRNPLAGITLSGNFLRDIIGNEVHAEVNHCIDIIHKNAAMMNRLIGDLLDVVSIDKGQLSLSHSSISAQEIVSDALALFEGLSAQQDIKLSSAKIPCLTFYGDRDRVLQVFSNLIGNALKFSPQGAAIIVSGKSQGDFVVFSISDSAGGIAEEQKSHIFERYWKDRPRSQKGAGLGLHIAKGIVEAHGGKIWVESRLGVGSTFFFTLLKRR
jgi:signal transduction histidine kinase